MQTQLTFKRSFVTGFIFLLSIGIYAQDSLRIDKYNNRYRFSYETVRMPWEPDMGFVGIGFDLFNIINQSDCIYLGINSYSAVTGSRPGLITFGVAGGYRREVLFDNFYIDLGGFVGGGGGGGAADGGGLIVRPHFTIEQQFKNVGFFVGVSHIEFPTGAIGSTSINAGISINSYNFFESSNKKPSDFLDKETPRASTIRVAVAGTQYYNFGPKTSVERPQINTGIVRLGGVQLERYLTPYWYGLLKLNGAVTGGADGYMSLLVGIGAKLPLLKDRLSLETRILGGPSGGGSIESGGGATAQYEVGGRIRLLNSFDLKLMYGKTLSPWGDFSADHIEVSIGKSFESLYPKESSETPSSFTVSGTDYKRNKIAFLTHNRTYFPPNAQTKNKGIYYLPYFNLLGFEFQKYLGERITINCGTVWAYQGHYGAYAEGLVGLTYYQPITSTWNINIKGMLGAAGGGAIDVGSGLMAQAFLGTEKRLNAKWSIGIYGGQFVPLKGNFTAQIVDLGIKYHINQVLKK
ncbi:MAG: hypothetical protein H6584_06910 [Flavobacteriales bacterium]|nr:hypothetical protein [Flavobacteriales bacterium]